MLKAGWVFVLFSVFFALGGAASAQTPTPTPPPDTVEKIATEEIKLNVLAFDDADKFATNLRVQDLVINEDGRLHQATSVRRIPANVLLVLDVGNEISYAKRNRTTAETARSLVSALQPEDSIAVIQYGDRVEVLSDWTTDRGQVWKVLGENKLGFGKRSMFVQAMNRALEFFEAKPLENRHMILITDGVDSSNDQAGRNAITLRLLASDINVHVVSYTKMQQAAIGSTKTVKGGGGAVQPSLPPGAEAPHSTSMRRYPVMTVNLDREMIRKRKEEAAKLKASEEYLTTIAADTNGDIFLPDSTDEMLAKTTTLAKNIDAQYVVTYTPKRPLNEAAEGEVRIIEATSRRAGIFVQGRRKFVVSNNK